MRPAIVCLVSLVLTTAASAADWEKAGGGLFARTNGAVPQSEVRDDQHVELREEVVPTPVEPFAQTIDEIARSHGLDPKLLHALVIVESAYRTSARSAAGARGLSQLMPATAAEEGVKDLRDPQSNLEAGAAYLAAQINRFGDLRMGLAAYNAGPRRVIDARGLPKIAETQAYVATVVDCYLALTAGLSPHSALGCRVRNKD